MVILIDNQEKKKLKFQCDHILTEVRVEKLDHGDYACQYMDGALCPVIFERKGLGDLFSTLTSGHVRFRKEIKRAEKAEHKLILIVEGTVADILEGVPHSRKEGISILRTMLTMWVRYDLMPVFCSSRREMALFIREFFEAFGREHVAR